MKKATTEKMSVTQLIEQYVAIGVAQDEALGLREIGRFNRLIDGLRAVEDELQERDGDQRRVLVALFDHPNMQVRLNAAGATLAVVPERARHALEAVAQSRHFPQAGDAGMLLLALDRGTYQPI